MPSLFEWLDNINSGKPLELSADHPYKDYVPFQINNGLSQNLDTVLLANEMNKRAWLSKELQYKFFYHTVSKKKRFAKWAKVEAESNQEDIDAVSSYFCASKEIAKGYLSVLDEKQLLQIKKSRQTGGADKITKGKK